jgi:hypothetical protein
MGKLLCLSAVWTFIFRKLGSKRSLAHELQASKNFAIFRRCVQLSNSADVARGFLMRFPA